MSIDAKVVCMIDDLDRGSLLWCLDGDDVRDECADQSTAELRFWVRQGYQVGSIDAQQIVDAWEDSTP